MAGIWWLVWLASEAAVVLWQFKLASVNSRLQSSPTPYLVGLLAIATTTVLTLLTQFGLSYFLTEPLSLIIGAVIFAAWGWHCWQQFVASWQAGKYLDVAMQSAIASPPMNPSSASPATPPPPQPIPQPTARLAAPRSSGLPRPSPTAEPDLGWTDFWTWARDCGYENRASIDASLGYRTNGMRPGEIRRAMEMELSATPVVGRLLSPFPGLEFDRPAEWKVAADLAEDVDEYLELRAQARREGVTYDETAWGRWQANHPTFQHYSQWYRENIDAEMSGSAWLFNERAVKRWVRVYLGEEDYEEEELY